MPRVALGDKPAAHRSGFQEFGLPYAADAAITRHLAAFLTAHRRAGDEAAADPATHGGAADAHDPARPDIVLFNGGVFESTVLRQRLIDCLSDWFSGDAAAAWQPRVLDNDRLDLAVARGAAYYGMVRRGEGVKIVASLARTYYIGIDAEPPAAVCLVPGSAEPGQEIALARRFELLISEPVEFPLYTSSGGRLPCGCTPSLPKSARSNCGAARWAARAPGGWSSTSARPRKLMWRPTKRLPRHKATSMRRLRKPAAGCSKGLLGRGAATIRVRS
jgi:hypothetical protein